MLRLRRINIRNADLHSIQPERIPINHAGRAGRSGTHSKLAGADNVGKDHSNGCAKE